MRILQAPYRRDVLLLVLAALVLRLVLLPWSQTVHADAVSRIHIALEWMLDPHYIKEGYWGPLHHYLNALFMWVFPGKITGPKVLNILCAALTVVPLYGFTLNLFNVRRGAVFAAALYAFAPIVIWTSLQALSEVTYGFFLAVALFALSEGMKATNGYRAAIVAGLAMTCAAALRYEAWVVIAVLTLVALLLRGWRFTAVFWGFAMIFPATWMIGNQLEFGDFLYSVNQNDVWNMGKEGINDEVTTVDRLKRAVFFPWSLALNISPIIAAMVVVALVFAWRRRMLTRTHLVWMLPFVVMALVFQKKAWEGSLMMHHRFLITWLLLFLPFVPLVFMGARRLRLRTTLATVGLVSVIPMAMLWDKVPYTKVLGEGLVGKAMDDLVMAYYREMEVVPRLQGPETDELLAYINGRSQAGDGLILDFHGWDRSYYVLLHALPNTMVVGGAKHEEYRAAEVAEFLQLHRKGHVALSITGMLQHKAWLSGGTMRFDGVDLRVKVDPPVRMRGMRVFAYAVVPNGALAVEPDQQQVPVFTGGRDAEFFDQLIRTDEPWYNNVRRQAFWKRVPVDTAMRSNVEYMLSLEAGE